MSHRHSCFGIVAACLLLPAHDAAAADKTSLACIQASDDGQTARDGGNLLLARESFAQCSAARCPALIRRDCTSWLEQVQARIPSVILGAHDAQGRDVLDAKVTIDGQRLEGRVDSPVELNPGPHVVRWEKAGAETVEIRVALRLEEKNRPLVATISIAGSATAPIGASTVTGPALPPSTSPGGLERNPRATPPRAGLPAGVYVLGAAGIAALGTFGYLAVRAKRDSDSLDETCAPACSHDDVRALKTKLLVADIALGVGIASLGAATFIALSRRGPSPKPAWDLQMVPTHGGARARVEIQF